MPLSDIVLLKWGELYDSKYVNILANAIEKHTTTPVSIHLITDDHTGVTDKVITHPIPHLPEEKVEGWWWKLSLFSDRDFYPRLPSKVVFMDLDLVILDNIDVFLNDDTDMYFTGVRDYLWKNINSSVLACDRSRYPKLWDKYLKYRHDRTPHDWWGDQAVMNELVPKDEVRYWPDNYVRSYKWDVQKRGARDTKIIGFHGAPRPHQAAMTDRLIDRHWRLDTPS